jgi:hypothetical protein
MTTVALSTVLTQDVDCPQHGAHERRSRTPAITKAEGLPRRLKITGRQTSITAAREGYCREESVVLVDRP